MTEKEAIEIVKEMVNTRIECEGCVTKWSQALQTLIDFTSQPQATEEEIEKVISERIDRKDFLVGKFGVTQLAQELTSHFDIRVKEVKG